MWVRPLAFIAVLVLNGERNPSDADGDSYNLFVGFLCPCREGICIKDKNTYVGWTRQKQVDSDSLWIQTISNITSPDRWMVLCWILFISLYITVLQRNTGLVFFFLIVEHSPSWRSRKNTHRICTRDSPVWKKTTVIFTENHKIYMHKLFNHKK